MRFEGRIAVVTGAASGIGRACALEFARRGADLVLADLLEERTAEVAGLVQGLGRRVRTLRCDVSRDADVDGLARLARREFGRVDLLMQNAGVALIGRPERISMADWMWVLETNLLSLVRGVRAFVPHMLERRSGYILNTASVAGLYAYSYDSIPYITSKFGAYGFTEGLAVYLRPHGIGVSVLCPGMVTSRMGERARVEGVADPARWMYFPERMQKEALAPEQVAPIVADGLERERFLIHTHPGEAAHIAERHRDIEGALAAQIATQPLPPID